MERVPQRCHSNLNTIQCQSSNQYQPFPPSAPCNPIVNNFQYHSESEQSAVTDPNNHPSQPNFRKSVPIVFDASTGTKGRGLVAHNNFSDPKIHQSQGPCGNERERLKEIMADSFSRNETISILPGFKDDNNNNRSNGKTSIKLCPSNSQTKNLTISDKPPYAYAHNASPNKNYDSVNPAQNPTPNTQSFSQVQQSSHPLQFQPPEQQQQQHFQQQYSINGNGSSGSGDAGSGTSGGSGPPPWPYGNQKSQRSIRQAQAAYKRDLDKQIEEKRQGQNRDRNIRNAISSKHNSNLQQPTPQPSSDQFPAPPPEVNNTPASQSVSLEAFRNTGFLPSWFDPIRNNPLLYNNNTNINTANYHTSNPNPATQSQSQIGEHVQQQHHQQQQQHPSQQIIYSPRPQCQAYQSSPCGKYYIIPQDMINQLNRGQKSSENQSQSQNQNFQSHSSNNYAYQEHQSLQFDRGDGHFQPQPSPSVTQSRLMNSTAAVSKSKPDFHQQTQQQQQQQQQQQHQTPTSFWPPWINLANLPPPPTPPTHGQHLPAHQNPLVVTPKPSEIQIQSQSQNELTNTEKDIQTLNTDGFGSQSQGRLSPAPVVSVPVPVPVTLTESDERFGDAGGRQPASTENNNKELDNSEQQHHHHQRNKNAADTDNELHEFFDNQNHQDLNSDQNHGDHEILQNEHTEEYITRMLLLHPHVSQTTSQRPDEEVLRIHYKSELVKQIEEKKRLDEEKAAKQQEEDAKFQRKIEEDQRRMAQEYEEEQRRHKLKQDEYRQRQEQIIKDKELFDREAEKLRLQKKQERRQRLSLSISETLHRSSSNESVKRSQRISHHQQTKGLNLPSEGSADPAGDISHAYESPIDLTICAASKWATKTRAKSPSNSKSESSEENGSGSGSGCSNMDSNFGSSQTSASTSTETLPTVTSHVPINVNSATSSALLSGRMYSSDYESPRARPRTVVISQHRSSPLHFCPDLEATSNTMNPPKNLLPQASKSHPSALPNNNRSNGYNNGHCDHRDSYDVEDGVVNFLSNVRKALLAEDSRMDKIIKRKDRFNCTF